MRRIKLLVVDDSILFREVLARYINQDDMIEVVGKAGDAYSARDMILQYEPDVMTLDLEMPRMDGIAFLKKLLPQYYISTIAVSSSEERKAACIEAGAVEFLAKPHTRTTGEMATFAAELCRAIRRAYKHANPNAVISSEPSFAANTPPKSSSSVITNAANTVQFARKAKEQVSQTKTYFSTNVRKEVKENPALSNNYVKHSRLKKSDAIIALGASTGGTEALEQVIRFFPEDTPPVIVVQHMPAGFTKLYADRLNHSCKMEVKEAVDGERLRRGLVIVGAGEHHLRLCKDRQGYYISSKPGEKVSGHCPSVDVMFSSVAEVAGPLSIGAILTGMGKDGAEGLLKMRQAGAFTIGQDKETCVVYGMPMEAYNIGAVEVQAPLYKISDLILNNLY
ncbi:MAG: chemotaxis-specific protein-glutamate methyltransferase CheB [Oscillospiraceae bacterium]|nr:chemotaxis-specific protein-glutamate methyltransferase CheB [Oscillospiraceae bacterium]